MTPQKFIVAGKIMTEESAIQFLKNLGYIVKPAIESKKIPTGCYRIDCRGGVGPFFLEGIKGEEWEVKKSYEAKGYEVIEVIFAEDQFFFV